MRIVARPPGAGQPPHYNPVMSESQIVRLACNPGKLPMYARREPGPRARGARANRRSSGRERFHPLRVPWSLWPSTTSSSRRSATAGAPSILARFAPALSSHLTGTMAARGSCGYRPAVRSEAVLRRRGRRITNSGVGRTEPGRRVRPAVAPAAGGVGRQSLRIEMSGGAPSRVRSSIADRTFLTDTFVDLLRGHVRRDSHSRAVRGRRAIRVGRGRRTAAISVARWKPGSSGCSGRRAHFPALRALPAGGQPCAP